MKKMIGSLFGAATLLAVSLQTHAQGFIYDQQSATNPASPIGNGNVDGLNIQTTPLTQSFIPTLSAIGFVQFEFEDVANNGNNGATVYFNLWTGSPNVSSATLLGSTTPVYMPNGFVNDGLGVAGVTNFYFSTAIALTPGQTYYLQPVVQSGDNPWDIVALDYDAYSNGELYGNGLPSQPTIDLWFREGVVPEPSVFALVGLSSLLIFFRKRCRNFLIIVGLFISILVHADVYYMQSLGGVGSPPFPVNIYGDTFPVEEVSAGVYIVDDESSGGRFHAMDSGLPFPNGTNDSGTNEEYEPDYTPLSFDTNILWIESSNEAPNVGLRLHNTIGGDNYQLLSTFNLLSTNWDLGQILFGASDVQADFLPVPMTNAMTFFKAHQANPVIEISDGNDSEELNPTNTSDPGYAGYIYIQNEGWATNDVAIYYTIGGSAQNGIDYSNLTGEVTISNGQNSAEIDIDPIADGLKPDQTIILTLLQNTNYLIDPSLFSATNILYANPEFTPQAFGNTLHPCPNELFSLTLNTFSPDGLPLTYTILTWPTHGTLDTNGAPFVTYTPTNCFEGNDSFTFKVNDGYFDSAPGTVTLSVTNQLYANPVTPQTCRGTPVGFYLNAGDYGCGEATNYFISTPSDGTVSNLSGQYFVYTPNGTNFTGTDSFNYTVYDDCGDTATNTVTVTVGDEYLSPNPQNVMTATNQNVSITLSASDGDPCGDDTNDYTYSLVSSNLTHGYLSGTPPNLLYTPTNGEGVDSFQFTASDGVWTSSYPATVIIYVVAGPILTTTACDPFGAAAQLNWILDTNVQQDGLSIRDFVISRSTNSGGPYTVIATNFNSNPDWMSYTDPNAVANQAYYYVVTFEYEDGDTGITYQSPYSNEIGASDQNPNNLISADAVWQVVTNLSNPANVVSLKTPFSSAYTNQYENLYPLPNTYWPIGSDDVPSVWSNHISLFIPTTNVDLVQYSIAIDNDYQLYVNGAHTDLITREGGAQWSAFQSFTNIAPNILHQGTNDISVVIRDRGSEDYFSLVVTTNTCGQ